MSKKYILILVIFVTWSISLVAMENIHRRQGTNEPALGIEFLIIDCLSVDNEYSEEKIYRQKAK